MTPFGPARKNTNNGMRREDRGISISHVTTQVFFLYALLPPSNNLFSIRLIQTPPTQCCCIRPTAGSVTVVHLNNCWVWGWATAMPVQLFLLWGNRVAQRFHRDLMGGRSLETYPATVWWLLFKDGFQVAGYGVLCCINKYCYSRAMSCRL